METFLTVVSWLAPPLLGALIGYITNRVAIAMLFRPRKEKRLFGKRLPLTPGVIPRNRDHLAKSIGSEVAREFLSEEAIRTYTAEPEFRSYMERVIPSVVPKRIRDVLMEGPLVRLLLWLRNRAEVEKLIEERVKAFDVDEMERVVRSVASQHLRWISWFGALLGALIGCLQLALNQLS